MQKLRGRILRSVSRSFYLSIRILPRRLRDPITLAYLLARATDTIADTAALSAEVRRENLRILADAIQGNSPAKTADKLRESFTALQKNPAERTLIEALPACFEWLARISDSDRADIREVLLKINRGQALDVQRFGSGIEMHALATAAETEEYAYLVAGCVGEFWTRLCFRHVPSFSKALPPQMEELGKRYGKGLQLVNIIRDAGSDLQMARCYFPADELTALGIRPPEILLQPTRMAPIFQKWREAAKAGLAAGVDYSCAIENFRIRYATVLPALIGARTLVLLRDAGGEGLKSPVKMPRAEVRSVLVSAAARLASPRALRKMFERLSH